MRIVERPGQSHHRPLPQRTAQRTPLWAMFAMGLVTLLMAASQLLMKAGVSAVAASGATGIIPLLTQPMLISGVLLGVVVGLGLTVLLKHGELSVLYPVIALGFIWTALAGVLLLYETLPWYHMVGIAIIIFGVSVIGHGGMRGRSGKAGGAGADHDRAGRGRADGSGGIDSDADDGNDAGGAR